MNKIFKSGFTLIELLVVIAIIAMLLSILLPSLNKAKEQAKKVQCAAHMKGLGLGLQVYASEYNGTFPACIMPGSLSWIQPGYSHWWQLGLQYAQNDKLIRCPSIPIKRFPDGDWNGRDYMTGFGLNYNGWNSKPLADWKENDPDGGFGYWVGTTDKRMERGGCIKIFQVHRNPSTFIMIGDNNDNPIWSPQIIRDMFLYGILGPPRELGRENPYHDMPSRHNEGGNIVFMDGHYTWYKTTELLSDSMLPMWSRGNIKFTPIGK